MLFISSVHSSQCTKTSWAITRTANLIEDFPTEIQLSPGNFVDLVKSFPSQSQVHSALDVLVETPGF